MKGSVLINFSENPSGLGGSYFSVTVNSDLRYRGYTPNINLFTTEVEEGDVITIQVVSSGIFSNYDIDISRKDYTTDDENGDNGVKIQSIGSSSNSSITFTATTISSAYKYAYVIDINANIPPTPTPTPTAFSTPASKFIFNANITGATEQSAITTLYNDLVNAGLWNKMYVIYPFVGGTSDTCKYNLVDARDSDDAYRITWGGGMSFSSAGIVGNAIDAYGNTHWNPSIFSTGVTIQNNLALSLYSSTNFGVYNAPDYACFQTGDNVNVIQFFTYLTNFTPHTISSLNDNTSINRVETTNNGNLGLFIQSRTSSTSHVIYQNGLNIGSNSNTNTPNVQSLNGNLYLLSLSGTSNFSDRGMSFMHISAGLSSSEAYTFNTIVYNFQSTLGRNLIPLPTPTPTVTPTSITPTPTPTISNTPTNTPTPSITPSVTPTNTITPTPTKTLTPTPTPTPNWPTLKYRVNCGKGNATGTFTYSNLSISLVSTQYNYSDLTFTGNGGVQTSSAQSITDLALIGTPISVSFARSLCKSTGTHTRDNSYGRIYINGTQVGNLCSITTNTSIPTCPTTLDNTLGTACFGNITINPGDDVIFEWEDQTI